MKIYITEAQLDVFLKNKEVKSFFVPINESLDQFKINTNPRIRHFLAQVFHETLNLTYTEEIASGENYENRKDLGNVIKGDGKKYKGRAGLQITGRVNYKAISDDLKIDFVNNPTLLAEPKYAMLGAAWFWNKKNLNKYADLPDDAQIDWNGHQDLPPYQVISRIINGGINGLSDRYSNYKLLSTVLK